MKILISWYAYQNDFDRKEGVRLKHDGPTMQFHEWFYEQGGYDKHVLLSSAREADGDLAIDLLTTTIKKKYPTHLIEPVFVDVSDPINLLLIKGKVERILLNYRDCDIDIFFSPGTSAMQVSWYICHTSLGLRTRLLQTKAPRFSSNKKPELLEILDGGMRRITADENEAVIERWLEAAYLRAPTLSQVVSVYRGEIVLGAALLLALFFALWQMRRAQLASQRGEQQKTMLLAVMSHEVRNAVNAVVSSIDLMARQPLEGPQRDLMAIAQASSRNLRTLLKSALDYTRSEVQGFTPDPVSCDVVAVARQVIESQRPSIEAKALGVRLDLPMGALPWLLLDETRLRQVLENLLSNAVKYTQQGHVGIALWQGTEETADGVRRLVVEVFDTGIGVPADRQRELFRAFAQSHGALDTRLGGTGLGLAICRDIVSHLGGRLDLTSEVDVGTAVRIELPTSLVPAVTAVAGEEAIDIAKDDPVGTVLLVEDHPANRQIIAAQLKFIGYATHAVDHGQAAIDAFEAGRYVGVLLDCELPDMSGYDIAAELRARERSAGGARTRFIAISANHGEAHIRRCEESGIDTVLGKPLSLEGLKAALVAPRTESEIDATFIKECLADVYAIRGALTDRDLIRAAHFAHRLKGGALVWGATSIAADIDRVEQALAGEPLDAKLIDGLLDAISARL